jgi:hypothetical protein
MTPVEHNPNCAIVRSGDIRAWCDCGAEIPVLNEIRANVSETIGAGKERAAIVRWLRYNSDYIIGKATMRDKDIEYWESISEAVDLLADMIDEGKHINETDDQATAVAWGQ